MQPNEDKDCIDRIVKFRKLNDTTHFSSSNSSTEGILLDNSRILSATRNKSSNQRLSRKNQLKLSNSNYDKFLLATTNQFQEVLSPIPQTPAESPYRCSSQDDQQNSRRRQHSGIRVKNAGIDDNDSGKSSHGRGNQYSSARSNEQILFHEQFDENEMVFNGTLQPGSHGMVDGAACSSSNAYSNSNTLQN